jgi:hypothetical protein
MPESTIKLLESGNVFYHDDDPNFMDYNGVGTLRLPGINEPCYVAYYPVIDTVEPCFYIFTGSYNFIVCLRTDTNKYAMNNRDKLTKEQMIALNEWLRGKNYLFDITNWQDAADGWNMMCEENEKIDAINQPDYNNIT